MKTLMLLLLVSVLGANIESRAEEARKGEEQSVRVAFVPGAKPRQGQSESHGPVISALHKGGPAGPESYFMQAFAGVGDKFPVCEDSVQGGATLFELHVTKGDDEHLVMEALCKGVTTKFELKRDTAVTVEVAGAKYDFLFPNTYEAGKAGDKFNSPQAMILITRK